MTRWHVILRNLQRHPMQNLLTTFGIILGVAVWVFFAGLRLGIQRNVLDHILPEKIVEVVPKSIQIGGLKRQGGLFGGGESGLNAYTVQDLLALDHVAHAYPKQAMRFPATVHGGEAIVGENVWSEFVADGIDPEMVQWQPEHPLNAFQDWTTVTDCDTDAMCGIGARCVQKHCVRKACTPSDEYAWVSSKQEAQTIRQDLQNIAGRALPLGMRRIDFEGETRWAITAPKENATLRRRATELSVDTQPTSVTTCPDDAYCDAVTRRCEAPVPVLISPGLLSLYNSGVHSILKGTNIKNAPPQLSEDALIGFTVRANLGEGMLGRSVGVTEGERSPRNVPLRLVGFSPYAIPIGATLPLGYIERWNREFGRENASDSYSSVVLVLDHAAAIQPVIDRIEEDLNLEIAPAYKTAQKASGMLRIVLLVFTLLAAGVIVIGSLHIAQATALRNHVRQREFGVMRCLGASSHHILGMLVAEGAVLGACAGALAFPIAVGAAAVANWAFVAFAPAFPFKPEHLFVFLWWWWPVGVLIGTTATVFGSLLPALRMAKMDAAESLRERQ